MKSSRKIQYIIVLGIALCWGGSGVSNASVQSQGSVASEKVLATGNASSEESSKKKTSSSIESSESHVLDEYTFDADSWRTIFQDDQLKSLIEQGLAHNTDLNVARLRIEQAEATLKSARLANLPSVAFSPTAGISSFGGEKAVKTYSLPLQASWQVDIFGRLKNAKM